MESTGCALSGLRGYPGPPFASPAAPSDADDLAAVTGQEPRRLLTVGVLCWKLNFIILKKGRAGWASWANHINHFELNNKICPTLQNSHFLKVGQVGQGVNIPAGKVPSSLQ